MQVETSAGLIKTITITINEDFLTYSLLILSIFSAPLALPSPPQPIIQDSRPSSREFSWMDCCFRCDSHHEWYELQGKGKNLREDAEKNSICKRATNIRHRSLCQFIQHLLTPVHLRDDFAS